MKGKKIYKLQLIASIRCFDEIWILKKAEFFEIVSIIDLDWSLILCLDHKNVEFTSQTSPGVFSVVTLP